MGEQRGTEQRVEALEQRIDSLERRLAALERTSAAPPVAPPAVAAPAVDAPVAARAADAAETAREQPTTGAGEAAPERAPPSSAALHRVAVGSFALVGALVLRTVTRQHLVGPELGTALGLVYCAALLFVPAFIERTRGAWLHARMLQLSGTLLVPVILLEMVGRHHALSLSSAALAIGVVGAAAAILAWLDSAASMAATLVALVIGVAALGARPEAALPRALVLVELSAAALWLAHARGWFVLRAFVLLPASMLLSAAVIFSARRPDLASGVWALAGGQLVIVAMLLGSNALRSAKLGRLERVLAAILLLWTYLLMVFLAPRLAPPAAAALATLMLVTALLLPTDRPWSLGASSSSLLLGALLAAASFPLVERSGLALGAAALATQLVGAQRSGVRGATVLSQLLALGAAASCAARGELLRVASGGAGSAAPLWIGLGLALVVLLLAVYAVGLGPRSASADERRARAQSWAFAPTLVSAAVVAYGALQLALSLVWSDARFVAVARSVIIAVLSLGTLALGRVRRLVPLAYLGLAGIVVLLLKVVLLDMVRLEGGYVVAAVLALGFAATATSIVLKRTPSPTSDPPAGDDAPDDAPDPPAGEDAQ